MRFEIMSLHYKVHDLLSAAELAELEAFAREPGRTVDECHQWMLERGFTLSRSAVGTWKAAFNTTDKFAASNEVAKGIMEAAKAGGAVALSDAALMNLSQTLFETTLRLQSDETVSVKDLFAMSMALKTSTSTIGQIRELKEKQAAAVNAAAQAAREGGSAADVVSKVREILGVAA